VAASKARSGNQLFNCVQSVNIWAANYLV
jgi:hypothetical protein